jgi:hypothetical protein
MSATHSAEEIRLSQDRRDAILTFVLDYFTGDQIDRRTLAHFAFLAEVFGITAKVKEMVKTASSIQGRQELALSLAISALNIALDDSPPEPSQRQLDRRKSRSAAKEFEQRVASLKPAPAPVAGKAKPVSKVPGRTTKYYHAIRSRMTPEELAAERVKRAEAMRRFRANRKAKKARNAVNGL